ncbi:uncharacterized protein LOC119435164 [Dermacentor silvarum]|uniref:uncharacterized protein LOC119435164 n=1 Tax=Dermacentor silvarum TaxID=543639 RepID=UPI0018982DEC|nr:uncharacterized protein LOC119435164 [Dermacentor silvarum]
MLRNLADAEKARLLDCLNAVWNNGQLPESWLTAIVVSILKARKPATAPSSYRPVSLTSAVCKVMETLVLVRLQWIARVLEFFPEQQTGFRSRRCTADSIGDVVSTLEQARSEGEAALLVLLDVQSAFDGLPHQVVIHALDALGVSGRMEQFVRAFLTGRSFRVRVGTAQSSPRPVTAGVPQGSPSCSPDLPPGGPGRLGGPPSFRGPHGIVCQDQGSPGASSFGYPTEHCLSQRRRHRDTLAEDMYLGLQIDHLLTWTPAVKAAVAQVQRVQKAVSRIFLRGRGCSTSWALRLHSAAATSRLLYALPLVTLSATRLRRLEQLHRGFIRSVLGLPRTSQIAATLAEAGAWPLSLLLQQRGLLPIDRLAHATDGERLLTRLASRPSSRMGSLVDTYLAVVGQPRKQKSATSLPDSA